jgi:tetratricopeptide (TPR) repeat protein
MPTDVLACQVCGHELSAEDWHVGIPPLAIDRCINCGDRVGADACEGCGLTHDETVRVHHELAALVGDPADLGRAARIANRQGRRVLALKLATGAAALPARQGPAGTPGASAASAALSREAARGLRVWLLSALGDRKAALEDARRWVDDSPKPSAIAWASLGQQLEAADNLGAAAEAYARSLERSERQAYIRARRARLLASLHREGQAVADVCRVFEHHADDARAMGVAIEAAEELAARLHDSGDDVELRRMLVLLGDRVKASAALLGYKALMLANQGDASGARSALQSSRRLARDLAVHALVDAALTPERSGWWRW